MEATTLKKKKSISKGKIKKTIKNVVCRPDPVFWPLVTNEEAIELQLLLEVYRVSLPEFKKMQWKELKLVPKSERPKPPPIPKVEGLIFGLSECSTAVKSNMCSALLIEATVNPKTIVQPLIETCATNNIPAVCLNNLKSVCHNFFGIPTICLGFKLNKLPEIYNKISELSKSVKMKYGVLNETSLLDIKNRINIKEIKQEIKPVEVDVNLPCPYLYRTSKQHRVFIPNNTLSTNNKDQFSGQNFINIDKNVEPISSKKMYMKMLLKKISNNPNRIKGKRK